MTLSFLLIGGAALAVTALFVTVVRSYETEPALAGEATAVGLKDPAAETLVGSHGPNAVTRTEWHMTTVSALCDAEDLLDHLEAQGVAERELVVMGNSCFAVRWR